MSLPRAARGKARRAAALATVRHGVGHASSARDSRAARQPAGGRHVLQRQAVARVLVPVPVGLHHALRDRAHGAIAHRLPIDACDRQHAAGRGRQEYLARRAQFGRGQRAHLQRQAGSLRHLDHGAARDAFKHALRRRHQHALRVHAEHVEARPLDHVARAIGQHHGVAPGVERAQQAHGQVVPVVVLGTRINAAGRNALHAADHQIQPARTLFGVGDPDIGHGESVELVHRQTRVARAPGRLPARDDHLHIGTAQARQAHALRQHLRDALGRQPRVQAKARAAGEEPLQVRIKAEEGTVPHGHHVVRGVGAQKTPVGDGNRGFADGHVAATHIGGALGKIGKGICNRHAAIVAAPNRRRLSRAGLDKHVDKF